MKAYSLNRHTVNGDCFQRFFDFLIIHFSFTYLTSTYFQTPTHSEMVSKSYTTPVSWSFCLVGNTHKQIRTTTVKNRPWQHNFIMYGMKESISCCGSSEERHLIQPLADPTKVSWRKLWLKTEWGTGVSKWRSGNFFKGPELGKIMFAKDYLKRSTKTYRCSGNTASFWFFPLTISIMTHSLSIDNSNWRNTFSRQNLPITNYKLHLSVTNLKTQNPGHVV